MPTTSDAETGEFVHPALFYASVQEYLDGLVPFIIDGLATAQPVLVAVPKNNLAALSGALGDAAERVAMADMCEAGRNPGRILGGVLSDFADKHADRPVRMIGEPIWPGRTEDEYPACVQHEALINAAFGGRQVTVLCPYDALGLDPGVLADARMTHPVLWQAGSPEDPSPDYAPDEVLARYNEPLSTSPAAVTYTVHGLPQLHRARRVAARYGQLLGLSADGIADLQLITTELATNSLQHTHGPCRLAFWQRDGHLVCEARDYGHLDDPLAGRRPPSSDTSRGRGLFVVNAVADLVRTHTTRQATTIHAYLRLAPSSGEAA
jgi:anti-sigma regulatory factor (Ser/Thr protein kinase)